MKAYPITVHHKLYRGADPKKRAKMMDYNRIAGRVQAYLNNYLAKQPDNFVGSFFSFFIASEIGESSDIVHDIISSTDGGSNGITIVKGDFDKAMAARSRTPAKSPELNRED